MRDGLMDDSGYHGYDYTEWFADYFCIDCVNFSDGDCALNDFPCGAMNFKEVNDDE